MPPQLGYSGEAPKFVGLSSHRATSSYAIAPKQPTGTPTRPRLFAQADTYRYRALREEAHATPIR